MQIVASCKALDSRSVASKLAPGGLRAFTLHFHVFHQFLPSYAIMLCRKCTGLHFKPVVDHDSSLREVLVVAWFQQFYLHSADPACLTSSADLGCHLCLMIRYHLFDQGGSGIPEGLFSGEHVIFGLRLGVDSVLENSMVFVCYKGIMSKLNCVPHYPGKIFFMSVLREVQG